MTSIPLHDNEIIRRSSGHEFARNDRRYGIVSGTEHSSPNIALRAQQIQGESYLKFGFVKPAAIDPTGRLHEDLDRSRGPNIMYHIAEPLASPGDFSTQGSVRVADVPLGGSLEHLAAFRHSRGALYMGVEQALRERFDRNGPGSVREVTALSLANRAHPRASFELIRHLVQNAIRGKTQETWLITFVPHAHKSIVSAFGSRTVLQVGDEVPIDVGDPRTSDDLRLKPVVIEPCKVPVQMVEQLRSKDLTEQERGRIHAGLMFIADGLLPEELGEQAMQYIDLAHSTSPRKGA